MYQHCFRRTGSWSAAEELTSVVFLEAWRKRRDVRLAGESVFESERAVAEFGTGLAAAVALDAFVLRTVLVPAAMHLFGRANWWLPRWLDRRLPRLAMEPRAEQAAKLPTPV